MNVIPLFHFFQHDVNTAQDWQPAESTRKYAVPKSIKWTIIFEIWVIIIQQQIFKEVSALWIFTFLLYSALIGNILTTINGHDGIKV